MRDLFFTIKASYWRLRAEETRTMAEFRAEPFAAQVQGATSTA
jgi:hypothetical protein